MRGSRVKALKRWFESRYNRPPNKSAWVKTDTGWLVTASEARVLKKIYRRARNEANWEMLRDSNSVPNVEKN